MDERAVAPRYAEYCARGRAELVVRRRTGPAGAERNRAGRVRSPRGVGAVDDAAAWVPQLIARLGENRPGPGRALRAHDARPAGLRRVQQAARAPLLAARAGGPGRGAVGARGDRVDRGC